TFCLKSFELTQSGDRMGNSLPVGQHAAEPARIDIILRALTSRFGDQRRCLTLGAHEQDATAIGNSIADQLQGAIERRHGLAEIDDVNIVANTEDEPLHLGVPAVLLVTEVNAGLKQLTHGKIWQCHWVVSFTGYAFAKERG